MNKESARMGIGPMGEMMKGMRGMRGMSDVCAKMAEKMAGSAAGIAGPADFVPSATPELSGLFEEWVKMLEEETLSFVKEKGTTSVSDIAAKLCISEDSVLFLVGKLARERRISIGEIRVSS